MHERVRLQLKECLDSGFVPSWLPRGRTSLLLEDKSKGNVASNYRTITCLPLMWKLLTGEIADQIYAHLALWWAPNYSTVQFLLKRSTRFLLTNVYKKMCGIFFFCLFRSWVMCKKLKRPGFYTLIFYIFINNSRSRQN